MQGPTGTRNGLRHNKTLTYVASNVPNKTLTIPVAPQQIPHPAPSSPARAGLHPIRRTDLGESDRALKALCGIGYNAGLFNNELAQASSHSNIMNRAELVEILATKNALTKAAANAVLDTLIETIQTTVKKGDAVQLVGFGTFKSAKRAARKGKNPSTGESIKIPATTLPKFVAGAKFKAAVDPKAAKRKAEKASAK